MRTLLLLATLAGACLPLLTLSSCGAADPAALTDAGHKALGSGDFQGAFDQFEAALAAFGADDAGALEAQLGACRAQAHLDAAAAKQRFLGLSAGGAKLEALDYNQIVSELKSESKRKLAIEVLAAGITRFPENTNLVALRDKIGKEAEAEGDADALKDLAGLGYVGGD